MYLILNKTEQYVETWNTGYPLKRIEELLFQRNEIVVISTGSNTIKYPELKKEYITELDNGTSIEDAKEMYMGVYGEMYINDDTVEINSRNAFPFVFPDYYDGDKDRKVTVKEYFNRQRIKELEENKSIDDKKIILMQSKRINELTELNKELKSGETILKYQDTLGEQQARIKELEEQVQSMLDNYGN